MKRSSSKNSSKMEKGKPPIPDADSGGPGPPVGGVYIPVFIRDI